MNKLFEIASKISNAWSLAGVCDHHGGYAPDQTEKLQARSSMAVSRINSSSCLKNLYISALPVDDEQNKSK